MSVLRQNSIVFTSRAEGKMGRMLKKKYKITEEDETSLLIG